MNETSVNTVSSTDAAAANQSLFMSPPQSPSSSPAVFRSVLPHEPPIPEDEPMGYLLIQGAFTPKLQPLQEEISGGFDPNVDDAGVDTNDVGVDTKEFWISNKEVLATALLAKFRALSSSYDNPKYLKILDQAPPYTKVRLYFDSSRAAHRSMRRYRKLKLTPKQLFAAPSEMDEETTSSSFSTSFCALLEERANQRPLQITQITTRPLPTEFCPTWTRSNPPKFRRLVARPDDQDSRTLEQEYQTTRFLWMTNLPLFLNDPKNFDSACSSSGADDDDETDDSQPSMMTTAKIARAVRSFVTPYDLSGYGVEVFVPHDHHKKVNRGVGSHCCHVGFRSAEDAQAAYAGLQERQHRSCSGSTLFVDYATITRRSAVRAAMRDASGKDGEEDRKPTRPQCTSTTDHIQIPGLVLISDFVSEDEEAALVAVLTGPEAPWAPSQRTASHAGAVVRRAVQHYGYVFDYQTANVLRDKSQPGADCPPLPAVPVEVTASSSSSESNHAETLLNSFIGQCLDEGRGWEVFAGVIERTRQYDFRDEPNDCAAAETHCFPHLNQLTMNQYVPGEGIGSHVDTPSAFADGLISISLNSGIVMEFRKVDGNETDSDKVIKKLVYLPSRSLLLMSNDARYKWEHMIVSRRTDTHNGEVLPRKLRVSLTLRTALSDDGVTNMPLVQSAEFPPIWGDRSQLSSKASPLLATPTCERDHVHAVYDAIATQWHHTRGKRGVLWPGATQFLQRLSPGSIIADIGCGDGKYFPAIWEAGSYVIGADISEQLLQTAMLDGRSNDDDIPESRRVSEHRHHLRNRPAVSLADCMNVPLRTNSCDAAICIAVLHHLSTAVRRKRCIEELVRIVKPGGLVNVQAWALEQEDNSRRRFAANDVFVPFNAQPKYLQMNISKTTSHDEGSLIGRKETEGKSTAKDYSEAHNADYDERKGLVVFKRYCHLYRRGELDEIALEVPGVNLVESGFESGNYFIIFEVRK